jgi:hypothetical protein
MGMFDTIEVDFPLPVASYIESPIKSYISQSIYADGFQSKDLECLMDNYFIDNNGFLYKNGNSMWESPKDIEPLKIKMYYHGHLRVYNMVLLEDDIDEQKTVWLEYDLKFTDGILVEAKMVRPTKEEIDGLYKNI